MNSNGNRPCIELYEVPELKRITRRKTTKSRLIADDVMKIALMICITMIACTLIICSYLSGTIIGLLVVIFLLAFFMMMAKELR